MMENDLHKEQENQLLDLLSVLFLCVFFIFSSINFPFTSLLFLIAAVVLRLFSVLHAPLHTPLLTISGAMLLCVLTGLLYTPDFGEGIRFFFRLLLCLLMAYLASRSPAYMRLLLRAFSISALIVLFSVYLQLFLPDATVAVYEKILQRDAAEKVLHTHKYFPDRANGICGYTSTTGYILSVFSGIIFVRAMNAFRDKERENGIWHTLLFILILGGIILTSKRSLFLAVLVICGLFLLFYYTRRAERRMITLLIFLACVITLFFIIQSSSVFSGFFDRLTDIEAETYSSGRIKIYQRTWDFFLLNPVLGQGSGSFLQMYQELYDELGGGAHNIYLQLLCENGIPGLLIFVAFFGFNLFSTLRSLRADHDNAMLCFSLAIQLLFLFYGFLGNPLYDEILFCIYCLFAFIPYTAKAGEEIAYE